MKEILTRKYGPLPVWAWTLAGLTVAYFGYRYYQSRSSNTTAIDATGQAPKGNLGTVAGDSSGGAGSLVLPNTQVGESAQTPPFASPSPPDTSAPATAPLGSADITSTPDTGATVPTDTINYDALATQIQNTPPGQDPGIPDNVDWGQLNAALGIPTMQDIQSQLDAYAATIPNPATPPAPAPVTQKVLPLPVTDVTRIPSPGKAIAE